MFPARPVSFRYALLLSAALLTALAASQPGLAASGVWTTHGPYGGLVDTVVVDPTTPSTIYVASPVGGVFKSLNSGQSWADASTGLRSQNITTLLIDPTNSQTLYAGSGYGLFTSTDGGAHWAVTSKEIGIDKLVINPAVPTTFYAISSNGPVYYSLKSGKGWGLLSHKLPTSNINSIAVDPVTPANMYAGAYGGLYRSIDGGKAWQLVTAGLGPTGGTPDVAGLWIDPTRPAVLYAETGLGLETSTDFGKRWTVISSVPEPNNFLFLTLDPNKPTTLYGLDYPTSLYTSTDSGATWSKIGSLSGGFQGYTRTLVVDPTNSRNLYAGTDEGLFVSSDQGSSWTQDNAGMANTVVTALAVDAKSPGTVYAATEYSGVFKSTDSGVSWSLLYPNYAGLPFGLAVDQKTPTNLYLITESAVCDCVLRSTDGGSTWTNVLEGIFTTIALSSKAPTDLYVGQGAGVEQSADGGTTWAAVNNGLNGVDLGAQLAAYGKDVMLADPGLGGYLTRNAGTSWTAENPSGVSALSSVTLFSYAAGQVSAHVGAAYGGTALGYFLASVAAPTAWTAWAAPTGVTTSACAPITALAVNPKTPTNFYAGGLCGVLRGTNNGTQLAAWSAGLPTGVAVRVLIASPTGKKVFAGTGGRGVYTTTGP
jgi:hypothetical protein